MEVQGLKKYFYANTGKFQDFFLRKRNVVKAVDGVESEDWKR